MPLRARLWLAAAGPGMRAAVITSGPDEWDASPGNGVRPKRKNTWSDRDVHGMRTTAPGRNPPAAKIGATVASGRGRAAVKPEAAPDAAPPQSPREPQSVAVATVRMLPVDEGLYALRIGEIAGNRGEVAGMAVPAALVSAPFAEDGNGVEIIASTEAGLCSAVLRRGRRRLGSRSSRR